MVVRFVYTSSCSHVRCVSCSVFCVDVVGRCDSDTLDPESEVKYGYPLYIADLLQFCLSLGVPEIDWIGTSMGRLDAMVTPRRA